MEKGEQSTSEVMHWADQIAQAVIKERGDKKQYVLAAGITPSGTVHVGNFREVITVDLCVRAIRQLGKKVRFIYSWDNYDVFRKVPKNMPQQELLKDFLRKPIVDVPDTFDCAHESYAHHHMKEVEESLPEVGIAPEFIYQAQQYRECKYAEQMKHALLHATTIIAALNKFRAEEHPDNWLPVSVFCYKCNQDTTKVISYDGNYMLSYECACGHKEAFDFRQKGIAKLVWRVDWPMRWVYEGVDFEPAGKDHMTKGGSRDTGDEICREVWHKDPPLRLQYDFIKIKGKGGKISSSSGEVVTLVDCLEIYEPEIVRWFFAGTRPQAEFSISFDLDVIKYYEDFDKCERIAFKLEHADEKEYKKQRRIYELSCVVDVADEVPLQVPFRHLTTYLLLYEGDIDDTVNAFRKEFKTERDEQRLRIRAICAWNWITKYAPDDFRWKVQERVNVVLSDNVKKVVKLVAARLREKSYTDEELHELFYNLCTEHNVDIKEFFVGMYELLINTKKGPRLASFILMLGERALKLMEAA